MIVIVSPGLFTPIKDPLEYIPLGADIVRLVVPIVRFIVVAVGIPDKLLKATVAP